MYTKQELESKSDKQLNKLVYDAEGLKPSKLQLEIRGVIDALAGSDHTLKRAFAINESAHHGKDYCNNWADIGPLIDEMIASAWRIRIGGDFFEAVKLGIDYILVQDAPTLRAAAIVYLLMQEGE